MSITDFIEIKLTPLANKMANQRHLGAIRDAYVAFMPFIIVGSILLVISSFPSTTYKNFMSSLFGENWGNIIEIPFNVIFSTMSLYISFLVAYKLAERLGKDKVSAGILSFSCFLILTPFTTIENIGVVLSTEWLGSKGLFVAMLGALIWTEIFIWLINKKIIIKMPENIPPAVQESFSALIPSLIILILALIVRLVFETTDYKNIHAFIYETIALPVKYFGTSYIGAICTVLSISLLWSVGINSGSMINGILRPFWMDNQMENLDALKAGITPPHVITEQFYDMVWMGGAGATLSLVIAMLIFAKSQHAKKISKFAIGSSIFNINEPVLFGLPVIMNPIMLIPFNIVPIINVTTQYITMSLGIVSTTTGVYIPWTLPSVLSGFIVTGSISGAVIQLINLIIGAFIYMIFFRIVDKQYLKNELELKNK